MNRSIKNAVKTPLAVLYPCLAVAAFGLFVGLDTLVWRVGQSYPETLAQKRYVDDENRLTPGVMLEICNKPLTRPELVHKRNGLFLRCGIPGLEGVYQIMRYSDK